MVLSEPGRLISQTGPAISKTNGIFAQKGWQIAVVKGWGCSLLRKRKPLHTHTNTQTLYYSWTETHNPTQHLCYEVFVFLLPVCVHTLMNLRYQSEAYSSLSLTSCLYIWDIWYPKISCCPYFFSFLWYSFIRGWAVCSSSKACDDLWYHGEVEPTCEKTFWTYWHLLVEEKLYFKIRVFGFSTQKLYITY